MGSTSSFQSFFALLYCLPHVHFYFYSPRRHRHPHPHHTTPHHVGASSLSSLLKQPSQAPNPRRTQGASSSIASASFTRPSFLFSPFPSLTSTSSAHSISGLAVATPQPHHECPQAAKVRALARHKTKNSPSSASPCAHANHCRLSQSRKFPQFPQNEIFSLSDAFQRLDVDDKGYLDEATAIKATQQSENQPYDVVRQALKEVELDSSRRVELEDYVGVRVFHSPQQLCSSLFRVVFVFCLY